MRDVTRARSFCPSTMREGPCVPSKGSSAACVSLRSRSRAPLMAPDNRMVWRPLPSRCSICTESSADFEDAIAAFDLRPFLAVHDDLAVREHGNLPDACRPRQHADEPERYRWNRRGRRWSNGLCRRAASPAPPAWPPRDCPPASTPRPSGTGCGRRRAAPALSAESLLEFDVDDAADVAGPPFAGGRGRHRRRLRRAAACQRGHQLRNDEQGRQRQEQSAEEHNLTARRTSRRLVHGRARKNVASFSVSVSARRARPGERDSSMMTNSGEVSSVCRNSPDVAVVAGQHHRA